MANGDGEGRRWDYAAEIGLTTNELRALNRRLAADFTVEDWGFAQFADIADERRRAIASDQIMLAADSVLTNLVEARTHEQEYNALADPGVPFAGPEERDVRLELHIVGFFRAFGSALDCLAGATIGILRVPRPILTASLDRDLAGLDPAMAPTEGHREVWAEFRALLDRLRGGGWMDWALLHRNALVHRPRQLRMFLPREPAAQLYLPPAAARDRLRFDLYLRRRPWLPDMQHLARPDERVENLFLCEAATQTIRGVMERLNETSEQIAQFLRRTWEHAAEGALMRAVA